ncbi:hypothetical protein BU24DRAFT_133413 [Aaosphaeria arxii CBS 175.79]|uniref:Uncharacterized protein n=1 Tax=Aaosphaeria arxii CBS 175.79 TaxID=1450172 RepID=A0A6A5Y4B5_9PLEO|nr:uncharacterized protein BU24DRAFT_133413 [Aaosphaeria arxii CBS 175.79]KAF2020096.1 hypothetical protein BU24DRAFT_133413 [Aaosphaeria arxii CBS 175.79]
MGSLSAVVCLYNNAHGFFPNAGIPSSRPHNIKKKLKTSRTTAQKLLSSIYQESFEFTSCHKAKVTVTYPPNSLIDYAASLWLHCGFKPATTRATSTSDCISRFSQLYVPQAVRANV